MASRGPDLATLAASEAEENCYQRPQRSKIPVVPGRYLTGIQRLLFGFQKASHRLDSKPLDPRYRHSGTTDRRRRARPDLDSGSRPESQRVMSCANRLVVTSSEYRDDDEVRYTGKTMLLVLTTAQQLLSNAQPPLLDAKRANSPATKVANSPRRYTPPIPRPLLSSYAFCYNKNSKALKQE